MTAPERIWAAPPTDDLEWVSGAGEWDVSENWAVDQIAEYVRADLHDATKAQLEKAVEALIEIIARWDTPAWKDVEPTAAVINRARAVLAEIEKGEPK